MLEYMSAAFLEHLKIYLQSRDLDLDISLVTTLRQLHKVRGTVPANSNHIPHRFIGIFKDLASVPELRNFLSAVAYFHTQARLGLINQDGSSISDPLQIFLARGRLWQAIESMICQGPNHISGCHCDRLKHIYRTNIYHCDQYLCYAYQSGFKSKHARDRHLKIHKRSHKCPITNCLFSEIGFHDAAEFQRHTRAAHPSGTLERNHANTGALSIQPSTNLLEIFRGAVALDQRQIIEKMLIGMQEVSFLRWQWCQLIYDASSRTSSPILSCLLDQPWLNFSEFPFALAAALEAENFQNIKLLLSRGLDMSEQPDFYGLETTATVRELFKGWRQLSGYIGALRIWSPNLQAYFVHECQIQFPEQIDDPETIFSSPRIRLYIPDEVVKGFNEMKQYIIWPEAYIQGAGQAMENGYVVALRICLENGGNLNATDLIWQHSTRERRLLFHAILKGGETCAELVKLLLKHGATVDGLDLHMKGVGKKMATVEKWVGCEWEEVDRRIQAGEDLAVTPLIKKRRT
ncbi:hypothetical protein F4814DRAFT_383631 [Daldinia grandis]|nr:hypothetical protein F4814DRAFT_383631 [Daldinia grandis]